MGHNLTRHPIPWGMTGDTIHLIATRGFFNKFTAFRARLGLTANQLCGFNVFFFALMRCIMMFSANAETLGTTIPLTDSAFPGGTQKARAIGAHASTNKFALLFFLLFFISIVFASSFTLARFWIATITNTPQTKTNRLACSCDLMSTIHQLCVDLYTCGKTAFYLFQFFRGGRIPS